MDTGNEPPAEAAGAPLGSERDGKGRFIRTIDHARRDARAAELRAAPHRLSYQQIADELGLADRGEAWRAVRRAMADVAREPVTRLIATESAELDDLYALAMEVIDRNHVTVSHGKVVTMLDPETGTEKPLPDDGPRLQAIQTALRVRESYRKLHGLDAEQKINLTGTVRYEVVGVDPADLT